MKVFSFSQLFMTSYLLMQTFFVGFSQPVNFQQPIVLVPQVAIQEIVNPLEGNYKPAWQLNLPYSSVSKVTDNWIAYLNNQGYSTYFHQGEIDSYYKTVRLGVGAEEEGYIMYTRILPLEEGVIIKALFRYKGDFISKQTHPKVYLVVLGLLHNFAFQELAKNFQEQAKKNNNLIGKIEPISTPPTSQSNTQIIDYTTNTNQPTTKDIFILDNYGKPSQEKSPITASTTPTISIDTPKPSSGRILPTAPAKKSAKSAAIEEQGMIDEINLLRSNPSAYIVHVETYIVNVKNSGFPDSYIQEEERTALELIKELKRMPALSTVQPHRKLYKACEIHAKDIRSRNKGGHMGSDGSSPLDRVNKVAPELYGGFENLVGGGDDIRQSVIMLLVDSGIPNRGHRKNLLDPRWKYAACLKVGKVGMVNNYWIQNFAKDK